MNQIQVKKIIQFKILFLGIFLIFYGCQKDTLETEEDQQHKDNSLFSKITFGDFKSKIEDKDITNTDINDLVHSQTLPIGELQYATQSESYVKHIDSTGVLVAEKGGVTSYTFKTLTQDMSKTTN
jgi:hypothetical protein